MDVAYSRKGFKILFERIMRYQASAFGKELTLFRNA